MGMVRTSAMSVTLLGMLLFGTTDAAASERPDPREVDFSGVEQRLEAEVAAYINRERVEAGLEPLEVWHENDLARAGNVDYLESDGEVAHRIVREQGSDHYGSQGARPAGEIQGGTNRPTTAARRVESWRNSPPHNDIMLSGSPTHLTVAVHCVPNDSGRLITLWSTAQFVAATPGDTDRPVAGHVAGDEPDDVESLSCRDADQLAAYDQAQAEAEERRVAEEERRQERSRQLASDYWPHAAGALAVWVGLSQWAGRRRDRRIEQRRAQLRDEEAALPQTRAEMYEQQRRRSGP